MKKVAVIKHKYFTGKAKDKKCKKCPGFMYGGGEARCYVCGWYLQPGGKITRTITGRVK